MELYFIAFFMKFKQELSVKNIANTSFAHDLYYFYFSRKHYESVKKRS